MSLFVIPLPKAVLSRAVEAQLKQAAIQEALIHDGVLDPDAEAFATDHVFESWTQAARCVSGISTYSGAYHWQLLHP